ncbi:Excinuclease ABC subunit C [Methanobrevibacter gottschalkii]|uniref:UvrABC system protein C n=2 Tax=Methanobrevibacter gottschalkii TaxID=190974 RepID=A0A3N5B8L6_9EURY|nr:MULTISPECIES: excinuclease ABC subunit UvrC [Methanobrevibacter]MCQ2971477.1 excinuclease ABC subunit UvrC [archaeon]OEC94528.1 excinuclease ABC subunit C [Methanobrevibacter sp. A27]RPF51830.1 excinuclease ABC subunit C [Methanobrevibacter gottschalkii DSM 11977]SEK94602.1 Excinuclease ABC subunit C [Methanobrevibacter gottschalkii]
MSTKVKSPDNLPNKPGVYIMRDNTDTIIYIGKAKNLIKRVKSYFREKLDRPKTQVLMSHFDSLEYIVTNSEKEALILEANLIKKHRPRYNVQLKDDKRYPYVKITDEEFPRLVITRNVTKNGVYFGPFTDVGSVKQTVKFLKSLFKIRTCRNMNGPCLNSQIDLCYAPCDGRISKKEYSEIINKIDLFFQGKYSTIVKNLKKEMADAAGKEEFEKAAVIRDQISSIEEIMEKQFVDLVDDDLDQDVIAMAMGKNEVVVIIMPIRNGKIVGRDDFLMSGSKYDSPSEVMFSFIQQYYGYNRHIPKQILLDEDINDKKLLEDWLSDLRGNKVRIKIPQKGVKLRLVKMAKKNAEIIKHQKKKMENSLIELKKYLKLERIPHVIEGYDISNISGKFAVGSKVSFKDAKPNKKMYKHFKMETPGPNDFAMMEELLTRRLKLIDSDPEPDLIVIDGGKGQLGMACGVLEKLNLTHIPIIGLAKEFEEIYIPNSKRPIIIPKNNRALHLLQQVRDESHRFAITYHRKLRSNDIQASSLDDIVGIGKKRKINLLREFGSVDNIKEASIEELAKIDGMNLKTAKNVYNYYH